MTTFAITIEACEPDQLFTTDAVTSGVVGVTVLPDTSKASSFCPQVEIVCDDPAVLAEFIFDNWVGEGGDYDWFDWALTTQWYEVRL